MMSIENIKFNLLLYLRETPSDDVRGQLVTHDNFLKIKTVRKSFECLKVDIKSWMRILIISQRFHK